jgi:hypothetical protein
VRSQVIARIHAGIEAFGYQRACFEGNWSGTGLAFLPQRWGF